MTPDAEGAAIPLVVHDRGREWTVSRAWPTDAAPGGRAAVLELRTARSEDVRAGRWDERDGARPGPWREDPRLPALAGVAREGTVVSHRAGRRAVVRAADGSSFLKVVRPGRAPAVVERHEDAASFGEAFRMPRMRRDAADEDAGVVRFEALPGRTLHALGTDPGTDGARWARVWDEWADAWCDLGGRGAGAGGHTTGPMGRQAAIRVHTAADEADIVRRWAGHAARERGSAEAIHAASARIARALGEGPAGRLVPAHRDLHDKQILYAPGEPLGLLDLDTASLAEPALDLGNLRAHAALRAQQGLWPEGFAGTVGARVDAVADRVGAAPERLAAYEDAARFRLACLYLFRPRWRPLAERLLAGIVAGR
ncbi:phosphotransferase family protein [Microbacterium sp. 18062]|uniref:phosphotransferase family protein n=1 Tax=Microbacterium sp. 18062 TaxID=2681410 RepID=UPI001359726A|nr:hypothetical protein [Microbacterium sp. 18062]